MTIDNIFAFTTVLSDQSHRVYTIIQPKVDYTIMHRWLLYCSYERLLIVAKELGITYSEADYYNFDCDTCYTAKEY